MGEARRRQEIAEREQILAESIGRTEEGRWKGKQVGRYEFACKVEVAAYVRQKTSEVAKLANDAICELAKDCKAAESQQVQFDLRLLRIIEEQNERLAELELTLWQRIARWFRGLFAPPATEYGVDLSTPAGKFAYAPPEKALDAEPSVPADAAELEYIESLAEDEGAEEGTASSDYAEFRKDYGATEFSTAPVQPHPADRDRLLTANPEE